MLCVAARGSQFMCATAGSLLLLGTSWRCVLLHLCGVWLLLRLASVAQEWRACAVWKGAAGDTLHVLGHWH
jgi:hypothetical protein